MKTIVLTGMMGSGKSTIGKLLSEQLNLDFFDLDNLIEQKEQLTISEIFQTKGEKYFREIEKITLRENFSANNQVISLGGGTFENSNTQEILLKNSFVIYLKTTPQTIFDRIKNNKSRPLLCDNMTIKKISEIIELREKNYKKAHFTISTDEKSKNEITNEILGVLNI
jgi:shikimate kinase